jgi:hypothetical protein
MCARQAGTKSVLASILKSKTDLYKIGAASVGVTLLTGAKLGFGYAKHMNLLYKTMQRLFVLFRPEPIRDGGMSM